MYMCLQFLPGLYLHASITYYISCVCFPLSKLLVIIVIGNNLYYCDNGKFPDKLTTV